MHPLISRRDVLKTLLVSSATSLLSNKVWAGKVISEIAPAIDTSTAIARIDLSTFPALGVDGGSVRLSSSGFNVDAGTLKPIIINRIADGEYAVLDSVCTHAGCIVPAYNSATGRITCPCHGSQYDMHGQVIAGPAPFSLDTYGFSVADGIMTIPLAGFGFNVTQTSVLNGSEKRLQLTVRTLFNTQYEVRYTPDLKTMPVAVPFAQTLSGAPATNPITGNGTTKSAYVVPQNGFYQIAFRFTST